jgi:hypothetical protein
VENCIDEFRVSTANLSSWELTLHGTEVMPDGSMDLDDADKDLSKPQGNNLKNRETSSQNGTSRAIGGVSGNSSRLLVTARPRPIEEPAQVGPAKLSPNLTNNAEGCLYSEANMCLGLLTLLFLAFRRNLD